MKWFFLVLSLSSFLFCAGCAKYWPQTLEPKYYDDSIVDVKEDVDDITGARTL